MPLDHAGHQRLAWQVDDAGVGGAPATSRSCRLDPGFRVPKPTSRCEARGSTPSNKPLGPQQQGFLSHCAGRANRKAARIRIRRMRHSSASGAWRQAGLPAERSSSPRRIASASGECLAPLGHAKPEPATAAAAAFPQTYHRRCSRLYS